MRLNKGRMTLMLEGMAVIGIGVFISLGSYYLGLSTPTHNPGRPVFFFGIVSGIFFIAAGVWYVIDGLK